MRRSMWFWLALVAISAYGSHALSKTASAEQCVDYTDFIRLHATLPIGNGVNGVAVSGNRVFLAAGAGGLLVFDISDPGAPSFVGGVETPGNAEDVALAGNFAYVADRQSGMQVVDVSNPATPTIIAAAALQGQVTKIALSGNLAFLSGEVPDLQIVDVSDPQSPILRGAFDTSGSASGVFASGALVYLATAWAGPDLWILDASDPSEPQILGTLAIPAGDAFGIDVEGSHAFVVSEEALTVVDVANSAAPLVVGSEEVTYADYVTDIDVIGRRVFITGRGFGLRVMDVTDPSEPALVGGAEGSGWADAVAVVPGFAYVVNSNANSKLDVFDVAPAASAPILETFDTPGVELAIVASGEYAYVAVGSDGVHVIDISNPLSPAIVSSISVPGYAYDVAVADNLLYVAAGVAGLHVVDIANPYAPLLVFTMNTPGQANALALAGPLLYISDGTSGLLVVDVSLPSTPSIIGTMDVPGSARAVAQSGATVCLVHGQSDTYWALEIIDVTVPSQPTSVASLATFAGRDVAITGTLAVLCGDWGSPLSQPTGFLRAFDITIPNAPQLEWNADLAGGGTGVEIVNDHIYAVGAAGLEVIDASDPGGLETVGEVPAYVTLWDVAVHGEFAHVAAGLEGLLVIPAHCASITDVPTQPTAESTPARLTSWPNPLRNHATFQFNLPVRSTARLALYDVSGRVVKDLRSELLEPGLRSLTWNGRDDAGRELPSGAYVARVEWPGGVASRRVLIVR